MFTDSRDSQAWWLNTIVPDKVVYVAVSITM